MTKIFLDTNIWLRYFLKDHQKQYDDTFLLISSIEEGNFRAYTSSIVFLELHFVLKKIYSFSDVDVEDIFSTIEQTRGITIIEQTNYKKALMWYKRYKIKFADCLIASSLSKDMTLVTYDREFMKLKNLSVKKPNDLI